MIFARKLHIPHNRKSRPSLWNPMLLQQCKPLNWFMWIQPKLTYLFVKFKFSKWAQFSLNLINTLRNCRSGKKITSSRIQETYLKPKNILLNNMKNEKTLLYPAFFHHSMKEYTFCKCIEIVRIRMWPVLTQNQVWNIFWLKWLIVSQVAWKSFKKIIFMYLHRKKQLTGLAWPISIHHYCSLCYFLVACTFCCNAEEELTFKYFIFTCIALMSYRIFLKNSISNSMNSQHISA